MRGHGITHAVRAAFASVLWFTFASAEARAGVESPHPPEGDDGVRPVAAEAAPPPRTELSVSFLMAFGAGGTYGDNSINRYGLGFGARAGVTLARPRLHIGGSFLSFRGNESAFEERRLNLLDAEVGYDFFLLHDIVVVRPQLAAGVAQIITIQEDNAGYPLGFHFAPGVLVAARLLPVLVSAEIRRDALVAEASATTALFGVGIAL